MSAVRLASALPQRVGAALAPSGCCTVRHERRGVAALAVLHAPVRQPTTVG